MITRLLVQAGHLHRIGQVEPYPRGAAPDGHGPAEVHQRRVDLLGGEERLTQAAQAGRVGLQADRVAGELDGLGMAPAEDRQLGGAAPVRDLHRLEHERVLQVGQGLRPEAAAGRDVGQQAMEPGLVQAVLLHLHEELVGTRRVAVGHRKAGQALQHAHVRGVELERLLPALAGPDPLAGRQQRATVPVQRLRILRRGGQGAVGEAERLGGIAGLQRDDRQRQQQVQPVTLHRQALQQRGPGRLVLATAVGLAPARAGIGGGRRVGRRRLRPGRTDDGTPAQRRGQRQRHQAPGRTPAPPSSLGMSPVFRTPQGRHASGGIEHANERQEIAPRVGMSGQVVGEPVDTGPEPPLRMQVPGRPAARDRRGPADAKGKISSCSKARNR